MEAAFYGIGVFTPAAGGVELVLEPRVYGRVAIRLRLGGSWRSCTSV
jgi:hypothetical protein